MIELTTTELAAALAFAILFGGGVTCWIFIYLDSIGKVKFIKPPKIEDLL